MDAIYLLLILITFHIGSQNIILQNSGSDSFWRNASFNECTVNIYCREL